MNEEIKVSAINIDEISDIGQLLPDGRYIARLSAVNPRDGKDGGAGMVEAVYDVLNGDHEGMEIRVWYSLKITKSGKNGKLYAPGISEMKQTFAAVGAPLQQGFAFPTDPVGACKIYGTIMYPTKVPKVEIALFEDEYTDKEGVKKKIQRKKIIGIPGGNATAFASAGTAGMGGTLTPAQLVAAPVAAQQPAAAAGSGNILDGLNLS